MILRFPDLDTLRLVLVQGILPSEVSLAPARAALDGSGPLWIEPHFVPPRKVVDELKRFNVQSSRKCAAALTEEVHNWLELLPLVREGDFAAPSSQTPVLFDLPNSADLARIAAEILRLGNDRQGYRWLDDSRGHARALLRVVGPPYYSLLHASDTDSHDAPCAFLERAPRVWVQLGWNHPLIAQIKPADGRLLLLRPPRRWLELPDGSFRDLYQALDFAMPVTPLAWSESSLPERIPVYLRLTRAGTQDVAELWVLESDAVATLSAFVQANDDQLLARLAFAIATHEGREVVIVRIRQVQRQAPPELVLPGATSYRSYLKLPNLFVPCTSNVHPPLRRDVLRQLLADDPNQLTWLRPLADGTFAPETVSQDAFRPLTDWVDYLLDHEGVGLQTWKQSLQFDFESFLCDDEAPAKPRKPPAQRETPRPPGEAREHKDKSRPQPTEAAPLAEDSAVSFLKSPPSELQQRLHEREARFLDLEGGLDTPERQNLWPLLAELNAALHHHDDANVCWLQAIWGVEEPSQAWLQSWMQAVAAEEKRTLSANEVNLDEILALRAPSLGNIRFLAAYVVFAASSVKPPQALLDRLLAVRRFLETHERLLSLRATWLTWEAIARLSGHDVLTLALARDRLLERLYQDGLRPEQELPGFLRFAGQPSEQRLQNFRPWLTQLRERAHVWSQRLSDENRPSRGAKPTHAYIDLLFAYGLARLGERDASRELLESAAHDLESREPPHALALRAFTYRIRQAQDNKPNSGPVDTEVLAELDRLGRDPSDRTAMHQRAVVDRLRERSRILEPESKIDAYQNYFAYQTPLLAELDRLRGNLDRAVVRESLRKLITRTPQQQAPVDWMKLVHAALDLAPRLGEQFAAELLDLLVSAYAELPEPGEALLLETHILLLERGLFVAAHFDRRDRIQGIFAFFQQLLRSQRQHLLATNVFDLLTGQCLRSLRKLGMRHETDALLRQLLDFLLEGGEIAGLTARSDPHWPTVLRALIQVAAGLLYLGRERQAEPILNLARAQLFSNQLGPVPQTRLARAYIQALGQAPPETTRALIDEIFAKLHRTHDEFITHPYFNLSQLDVVEAVVTTIIHEDGIFGGPARRWLDDDEFLVRQRLHRDYQRWREGTAKGTA